MIRSERFVVSSNIRLETFKLAVFNMEVTQVAPFSYSACFVWDLKNQQRGLPKIPAFQSGDVRVSCVSVCVVRVAIQAIVIRVCVVTVNERVCVPACVCV